MRLLRLTVSGLGAFHEPATLDLEHAGRLVAIVGRTGAGKSTLLEAWFLALYGRMASKTMESGRRAGAYDMVTGQGMVQAEFGDAGQRWTAHLVVDGERQKTERYLRTGEDEDLETTSGKRADYDASVLRLFGSADAVLASVLAAQRSPGTPDVGSFLTLGQQGRKRLFYELLQLGRFERMAKAAGARHDEVTRRRFDIQRQLAGLELTAAELTDLRARVDNAVAVGERLSGDLARADAALAEARAATAGAQSAAQAVTAAKAEHASAERAAEAAVQAAAAARVQADTEAREDRQAMKSVHDGTAALLERGELAQERARRAVRETKQRTEAAAAIVAAEPEIQAARLAIERWDRLEREAETAEERLYAATQAHKNAVAAAEANDKAFHQQKAALSRLVATNRAEPCLPNALWRASEGGPVVDLRGTCPALENSRQAKERLEAMRPDESFVRAVEAAHKALLEAEARRDAAIAALDPQFDVEGTRKVAALHSELPRAREAVTRGAKELASIERELAVETEALRVELTRLQTEDERLVARVAARAVFWQQEFLDRDRAVTDAKKRCDRAHDAWQALAATAARSAELMAQQGEAEREVARCRQQAETAQQTLGGLRERVHVAEDAEQQAGVLRAELLQVNTEILDWTLLVEALGYQGISVLELAAAAPEISGIANELLAILWDGRFTLAFETQREKRTKPGEFSEAFDVQVLDCGRRREAGLLSGGQQVVVGAAIGAALAIFNARHSATRWGFLIQDELAGALDADAQEAYVDMLRRVIDVGGFEQLLFVSHNPAVCARADARIEVADGRIQLLN